MASTCLGSAPSIELDHVTFRYRPRPGQDAADNKPALLDVSFTIEPGTAVAVVGATGSGKTTLARLLTRLADPDEGAVRIGGVDLREVSMASLRRSLVMVPQEPFLYDTSVADNVRFGRPGADDDDVLLAFVELGLEDWIMGLSEGLATRVGERGDALSAGERQLVALARAYVANPPCLVLDEATSSVDALTETRLAKALDSLARGRTSVTIAHRLSTASRAQSILVFDRGRLVEHGTHRDLLATGGVYVGPLRQLARRHVGHGGAGGADSLSRFTQPGERALAARRQGSRAMKKMITACLLGAVLAGCGGGNEVGIGSDTTDTFCEKARVVDSFSQELDDLAVDASGADVQKSLDGFLTSAEAALDRAPSEIEDTMSTVLVGVRKFRDLLAENDFDFAKALDDPDFAALIDDAKLTQASDELDAYLEKECGITAPTDTAAPDASSPAGSDAPSVSEGPAASDVPASSGDSLAEQLADEFASGAGIELTPEQRSCVGQGFLDDVGLDTLASLADAQDIDAATLAKVLGVLDRCGVDVPLS